jgi:hypothetical protein
VVALVALYDGSWQLGEGLRRVRDTAGPVETPVWVPTPRAGRVLSLGYNEMAADFAWARTTVYYGDGLEKNFAMSAVEPLVALVNALDPRFRRPYLWGAYAVTFRQRAATPAEYRSSVAILERGVAVFPQDWELAWLLGLRYYLDIKGDDPAETRRFKEMGVDWLERAMRLPGAPGDLPGLAATLRTQLGQKERALRELREMILTTTDEAARANLLERYERMASQELATALRSAQQDFATRWHSELPYAPASMFLLVGEPAPVLSAPELLAGAATRDLTVADEEPEDLLEATDPPADAPDGARGPNFAP